MVVKPFRLPTPRATLVLEDEPYAGVEIDVALRVSMADFFAILRSLAALGAGEDIEESMRHIGGRFIEIATPTWNIEAEAGPVPVTLDGYLSLPLPLASAIVSNWLAAVNKAPPPLARPTTSSPSTTSSSNGASSLPPLTETTPVSSSAS